MYQKEVTETQKELSMIILEQSGKEEMFYPNLLDREGLQLDGEEFKKKNILIAFYRLSHLHLSIYPIFCCTILLRIQKKKEPKTKKTKQTKNNNNTGNPKDRQKRPHPF